MTGTIIVTLALAFVIILGAILAMSIGVLNGRKAISGSCGGLNNGRCALCTGNCSKGKNP